MNRIQKILVPVDFSDGSRAALEAAIVLAEACGAGIDVLHVWDVPDYGGFETIALQVVAEGGEARALGHWIRENVDEEMERFLKPYLSGGKIEEAARVVVRGRVESGRPHEVILRIAETEGVDLIALGTHGRGALARFVMGSVTDRILREAPCPVLAVRPKKPSKNTSTN